MDAKNSMPKLTKLLPKALSNQRTKSSYLNKLFSFWFISILLLISSTFYPFNFGEKEIVYGATYSTASTSSPLINVYGIVVDSNNNPIWGVSVSIYDSYGSLVTQTQTSSAGNFIVTLNPGTYRVQLDKVGYEYKSITFNVPSTGPVYLGTITLGYSLSLSVALTYLKVNCLSEVNIPITITEKGSRNELVNLSVNAPKGWSAGVYLGQTEIGGLNLAPNQVQNLNLNLQIPYNASGLYNVTIVASGWTIQNETISVYVNNVDPQLLTSTYSIIKAMPDSTANFDLTISNKLSERFFGIISIELPNGWIGSITNNADGNNLYGISLDPGSFIKATATLQVPGNIASGDYVVAVKLEGTDPYFISKLQLHVVIAQGAPVVKLHTDTPYLDAYAGQAVSFPVDVKNVGDANGIVSINLKGLPPGYSWMAKDPSGNVLSKLYLKAGEDKNLRIVVSIPPLAEPSVLSFALEANSSSSYDNISLSLGILGSYSINYVTQSFYVESTAGATTTFQVQVQNTGYSSLTNVKINLANIPSSFDVQVDPNLVLLLKPQDTATFTITITTTADVSAGDYYITLGLTADQLTADQTSSLVRALHVYLKQSSVVVYVGVGIVLVVLVALFIVYRRYGRR
ncbi:MAG: NEW3 domain-containing protein [Thermoproteota archaeon]